jgi:HAD superfamily hydrolase (TIGR01509 family)
MGIEAFIFDVDGTLADTEEAHRRAFNRAFAHHGLGWHWSTEDYRALLRVPGGKERIAFHIEGLPLRPAEQARLQTLVGELHADKTRFYADSVEAGDVPLRTGARRLLEEAVDAGLHLAIASTTSAAGIDALLQAAFGTRGLDLFHVIACGDQVAHKKPAPDIYRLALAQLGLAPERAIAFEDSAHGLRAARAAGLWTVVAPTCWTAGEDFSGAGLLLPHWGDPEAPLPGEPGGQLAGAAWLGCLEAARLAEFHHAHHGQRALLAA